MSKGLEIQKKRKLIRLEEKSTHWLAYDESKNPEAFDAVVLTCPLPQTIELFQFSHFSIPESWFKVEYASALVLLVESENRLPERPRYQEWSDGPIHLWINMQKKHRFGNPSWVLVSTSLWAQKSWNQDDQDIIHQMTQWLVNQCEVDMSSCQVQLKRWKYSFPWKCLDSQAGIYQSRPLLLVTGDAFHSGTVAGAALAAQDTFQRMKEFFS